MREEKRTEELIRKRERARELWWHPYRVRHCNLRLMGLRDFVSLYLTLRSAWN